MNTDRQQEVIQYVVRQQNPFHDSPIIKIRRRGLKKVWHAIRNSGAWAVLFRFLFNGGEIFCTGAAILVGLLTGIILAVGITGVGGGIAITLLDDNLAHLSWGWFTRQNWRDYTGGILAVLTLFCLPYLWWGLPLTLAFRAYRLVHQFFARRRLWQQSLFTHNADLSLLKERIANSLPAVGRNGNLQALPQWIVASGKVIGSITGFIAALLVIILWVKFVLLIWSKSSSFWQMMIGWLSCLTVIYLPGLIVCSFRSGRAVASMITALFQDETYREALDVALDDLLTGS